mgnify:CR=1 FL=1
MDKKWWHHLTAYQIYTRSFCDSNGDGIGDFQALSANWTICRNWVWEQSGSPRLTIRRIMITAMISVIIMLF